LLCKAWQIIRWKHIMKPQINLWSWERRLLTARKTTLYRNKKQWHGKRWDKSISIWQLQCYTFC
jgi:hypothetical protein